MGSVGERRYQISPSKMSQGDDELNQAIHLIFSNILTEKRLWLNTTVSISETRNRPSMAYSTIQSLRDAPITSADFYIQFDETTEWSKDTIQEQIMSLPFPSSFQWSRLTSFDEWLASSKTPGATSAKQILLFSNEDHVHIRKDFIEFNFHVNLLTRAQNANPSDVVLLPLSHFPETHALIPISRLTKTSRSFENVPMVPSQIPAGPIVVGRDQYESFWKVDFSRGKPVVGLENPRGPSLRLANGFAIPPRTELFRHLDSYGHIGLSRWPYNPISPKFQLIRDSKVRVIVHDLKVRPSLLPPSSPLDYMLADDLEAADQMVALDISLLKAISVRPSWRSSVWVSTRFDVRKIEVFRRYIKLLTTNKALISRLAKRLMDSPIILILPIVRFALPRSSIWGMHFYWYLTYGSSIGYWKLLADSVRQKLAKSK